MLLTKEKWIIPWRKFKTASHTFYGSTQVKKEVHLVYIPKLQTSRVTQGNTISKKKKQNKMWLLCTWPSFAMLQKRTKAMIGATSTWLIGLSTCQIGCSDAMPERKQPKLSPGWSSTGAVVLLRIEYIPNKTKLPVWHFKEWLCSSIL